MFDWFKVSWVAFVTLFYLLSAYITVKNNIHGGKWFLALILLNASPLWAIVSRYSKDVVLDAFIFDTILVVTYSIGLLYFTNSISKMGWSNYLGVGLMILGIFVFKRGI